MIFAIFMLVVGFFIGFLIPVVNVGDFSIYFVVGIMSTINSIIASIRAVYQKKYRTDVFISSFLVNTLLSLFFVYVGDSIALPLYYSALFVFGVNIFKNMSHIRNYFLNKLHKPKDKRKNVLETETKKGVVDGETFFSWYF